MPYFESHERQIYTTPDDKRLDPLVVQRQLVITSKGRINEYVADWNSSEVVAKATAEGELAAIAREVFGYLPFDQEGGVTDAVVLESLFDYLHWIEGKGERGARTLTSTVSSDSPTN